MTYCVGLLVNEGMVLLSDTRTNAGLDHISTYKKMYIFEEPGERVIVMMTAGNLSVTQNVIARLEEAIEAPEESATPSIMHTESMFKVAEVIGKTLSDVATEVSAKMTRNAQAASASMIVAGQRQGGPMRMFMVYPEGNFIEATPDTPFFQIGEHKYGKPILDRVVTPKTSLADAQKVALLSMDSTLRSNLSVGMPLDMTVIRRDECRVSSFRRIEQGDEVFAAMSTAWSQALRAAFSEIEI
ncbi:proteasome-type protease [Qingshengfaniella alkalisoli]|uniref:Peptidase n=1 Tax=Qingshengfaniella alkalisoli TaxID=2599296 RepID=A0A5B8I8X3_9RHOB|nr:proteasome-type protease [Qingshengfaniella alkalisoli]QDY69266.1 peptidase [Qingshengfaniella alkalisoli]